MDIYIIVLDIKEDNNCMTVYPQGSKLLQSKKMQNKLLLQSQYKYRSIMKLQNSVCMDFSITKLTSDLDTQSLMSMLSLVPMLVKQP